MYSHEKLAKLRTSFSERYKMPNGYQRGNVHKQSTKAQPLDLRRMADELTAGITTLRWVPDKRRFKNAPDSFLPSTPPIIK